MFDMSTGDAETMPVGGGPKKPCTEHEKIRELTGIFLEKAIEVSIPPFDETFTIHNIDSKTFIVT